MEERNVALKAYERFVSLLTEQVTHFTDERRGYVAPKPWGKYEKHGLLAISREIFEREMTALGYDNLEAILEGWVKLGKLIPDTDRNRRACRRTLVLGQGCVEAYLLRVAG